MWHHKGVKWVTLGWSAFIAENLVLTENREFIIDKFGKEEYHTVYNGLSTAACFSVLYGLGAHGASGPKLPFRAPPIIVLGLRGLGLVLGSQLLSAVPIPFLDNGVVEDSISEGDSLKNTVKPKGMGCPFDFKLGDADEPYGVLRITRHPGLWAIGLLGASVAVTSTYIAQFAFFMGPLAMAFIGGWHHDSRLRRGIGGTLSPEVDVLSSNIPFYAFVTGNQNLVELSQELKLANIGIALILTSVLTKKNVIPTKPINPKS